MNALYFKLLLAIGLRVYGYVQKKRKDMTPEQITEWDRQWVDEVNPEE